MKRSIASLFLIVLLVGIALVGYNHLGMGQASKEVKGIIDSDITWIKANSPYILMGNILVSNGVTLTIEAGTTINLKSYYLMVNGTLTVRGNDADKITFQGGNNYGGIIFTELTTGWNEQTRVGSIIDNASFNRVFISITGGTAVISNSGFYDSQISITGGAPVIADNSIRGGKAVGAEMQYFTPIRIDGGSPEITRNNIYLAETGIEVNQGNPYVFGNNVTGCHLGIMALSGTIERNYIENPASIGNATVKSNTIGIDVIGNSAPTLVNNNLGYLHLSSMTNVDATNNWWGTADSAMIDQRIYDFNDDFNLGKVNYTPFLTEANPQAMPDQNAPMSTPDVTAAPSTPLTSTPPISSSQNPTATPIQPNSGNSVFLGLDWIGLAIVTLLGAVVVLLFFVVVFLRRRSVGRRL